MVKQNDPTPALNREKRRGVGSKNRRGTYTDTMEDLPEVRPVMVTRQQLPKYFPGMAARTWANMAHEKKGPKFYRIGKLAWYVVDDVIEYLTQNPIHTTLSNK